MARTLHLLAWISVLTAAAYKYPVNPQQLPYATFPIDTENQDNYRSSPNCGRLNPRSSEVPHDGRMNERSIAPSDSQRVQEEVRIYHTRTEEPVRRSENGSSKILASFLKPSRRRGQVDNNQITFPGPTAMPSNKIPITPEIPDSCKKSTFCEDVPNYPQEVIERLLAQAGQTLNLQVDRLDLPDTPDITQRLGPTEDNVELCNFTEKVVYPQGIQGTDGKWYTLVNRKDNPVQGFRVEICDEDGSSCSDIIAAFQEKYSARCKQKYVIRTASVIDEQPPKIIEKQVKLPSCCSCVARYHL